MKVLEQPEGLRDKGFIYRSEGYLICSEAYPCLNSVEIFICGSEQSKDNLFVMASFESIKQASEVIANAKAAIEAYNATLEPEKDEQPEIIVTYAG